MAISLMQQHRSRLAAARAQSEGTVIATMPKSASTGPVGTGPMAVQKQKAMLDVALQEALASLSGLNSISHKIMLKRDSLIPQFKGEVERRMAANQPHELISYYLVWCIDAELWADALQVAAWCLEHKLTLPEKFKSTIPFFVATKITEWANTEFKAGHSFEPYLTQAFALVQGEDVADAAMSGFYRLYGREALQKEDYATAVEQLEKAVKLGAKVSTDLATARKKLEKQPQPEPTAQAEE